MVATGRVPNTAKMGLEDAGIETQRGFVAVDEKMRVLTKHDGGEVVPHVYCIGDANGKMMLAHAASAQGISAIENICGREHAVNHDAIPAACFTHPEFNRLQHDYFIATARPALVLRGTEGEVVASTRRAAQIDWLHDGRCDTLVPAQGAPTREIPALPDAHDAPATARWIQSVLAGERPVPEPIAQQVAAILQAVALKPRARSAVPA